jgi:hypothetical protein
MRGLPTPPTTYPTAAQGHLHPYTAAWAIGCRAPLAAILVRAIDLASISAEEFVEKRIDFVILVLDRDPMRRSGELFESTSHASGF